MTWALIPIGLSVAAVLAVLVIGLRAARKSARAERDRREAAERQLSRIEGVADRNSAILRSAMDGFFVLGEDYRFKEVNESFCKMTGYSASELLDMKMTDMEVSAGLQDGDADASWRTGLHYFSTSHRHKLGHTIQLENCVIVLHDDGHRILVGFARDVTERSRVEQALRKSEAQYRNLVETSRDVIWSMDLDGRWTFVNNAARGVYGYEPAEMLGHSVTEFVPAELIERTEMLLDELRAGKPRLRFETRHIRKDGSAGHLTVSAIPVRDDYGTVVGYAGTAADVSERKEAEQQLHQAHCRFESLVAGMPLGYVVWSPESRVLEWNPAASEIFGYSGEEALGREATELLIPTAGRSAFDEMLRAVLDGRRSQGVSILLNRKKSGEKIQCEWYNTLIPNQKSDGIHGVATMIRDVSERERFEAQLRQSQKLESLGMLAGGVAHDFNNLLVGIMGNASLAMDKLPGDEADLRPLLERVVNAGRRATDLTQRMLAYAGRATCDVRIMDLNSMVREMVEFVVAAVPKNVALQTQTSDKLPLIKADSGQIQQVIMNLLMNGAEAIGDEGGEVAVSTWVEQLDQRRIAVEFPEHQLDAGPHVCLEVRDTGCGMSADILSRIYDPFFSTKFAGRGLGLSAILGIVRAHRGTITVSSREGVGTTFRVLLPAAAHVAGPQPAKRYSKGLPRGSTLLVIDDEEDIRDVVRAVLEMRGISVITAEDGRSGIAAFRAQPDEIDAILLDMNMPGMSGEAVFEELLRIRPDAKVILSTGYSEQEVATHFANAPLAGFVHKPYTANALVEKIGAAMAGVSSSASR